MRLIPARDYRRMPWKNGGGETVEIAGSPSDAAIDGFDWRVSMAHVAAAGPFSLFPAVDRTLAVIGGNGVVLTVAGRGAVTLTARSAPLAFPGDVAVDVVLVDGAIDDFNVMTRRGRYRHLLSRWRAAAPLDLPRHGDAMLVLVRGNDCTAQAGGRSVALSAGDAIIYDRAGENLAIVPDGEAELFIVDLWDIRAA